MSEHLANERTYLAWLRTSFALLTLGFATNKFGQFMIELRAKSDQAAPMGILSGSRRFGLGMVILATVLMAFSSWHYQITRKGIESGDYRPSAILIWFVSFLSILFGFTAIALLLHA